MMSNGFKWLAVTVLAAAMFGCEFGGSDSSSGGGEGATESAPSGNAEGGGGGSDAISLGGIAWLGADYSGARVTTRLASATTDGNFLYTQYDPYSWPATGKSVRVDAICCFFYERGGQMVGGKYDFWRVGGQSAKTMENVKHGYQGHSMPASGTRAYTMIVSLDGSQRSNIVPVSWQ